MSELKNAGPPAVAVPPASRETRPRPSILMVDDQPARLLTYEAMLAGLGVECVRALSGVEALAKLLKQEFAVILLDVEMPQMDGFELARTLREHPRLERTPIIFVTGVHVSELDRLKGYEVGAIDYIAVPVVPEILRSKIALLVELHQRRAELKALNHSLTETRARAEAEYAQRLAEKDAQLLAAFEQHPDQSIVILKPYRDAHGEIADWIYVNANSNAAKLLSVDRQALLHRRVSEVLGQRAEQANQRCTHVFTSRTPMRYEAAIGEVEMLITIFPASSDMIVSSAIDVTERKRAITALREAERRNAALFENAPVGIAHNAPDGRFQYANAAFCRLVGYSADELFGMTWQEITYRDDLAADYAAAKRVLAGELPHYKLEKRYVRKDGSLVWASLFGNFVRDDSGRPVQGVTLALDITQRDMAERRLKDNDRRKDEFLAMLAHELRNPIAPIRNAAEALSRLLNDHPRASALVGMIQRQGAHLSRILDDLLDIARITQGRIELRQEVLNVAACVEHAMEMVQPLVHDKAQQLVFERSSVALNVYADRVRLEQCIGNVLTNAAKYTHAGGDIRARLFAEDRAAVIEVCDSGIGIAPEFLPHIFELFTQGERAIDRSEGGLGIGLSVCKQLLEMHGGSIHASSEGLGRGSTFTLRMPLHKNGIARDIPDATAGVKQRRILIVDDNSDAADSLAMCLQLDGHRAEAVYSPERALERQHELEPEVVLLDLGLPRIDGYEVARRLRAVRPAVTLVALTGYGQEEDKRRTLAAGFDAHLVKPVDIAALRTVLESRNEMDN